MTTAEEAKAEMEAAREEVVANETEIQKIKGALRQLGSAAGSGEDEKPNSFEVTVLRVEGLPETAQPNFSLQLSSPVEEKTLKKLHDPQGSSDEESLAVFAGVETAVATLTLTVRDAEIELGSSEPHDVAPLCPLDAMTPAPQYVSEIPIAIVSGDAPARLGDETPFEDAQSEEEVEGKDTAEESKEESSAAKDAEAVVPTCVVMLRVTYKPSAKDQREALYDLLNKSSQKKTAAIDRLRKSATAVSRAANSGTSTEITSRSGQPAVKPGFLNKSKKKEPHKIVALYNRYLGPQSLIRQIVPVAKNYVIFFGAVALMHFKGQLLALPPPV